MAARRLSSSPRLAAEGSPWDCDEAAADAVLAQFADEAPAEPLPLAARSIPTGDQPAAARSGRTLRDGLRNAVLACLSAMALGASFAIGFGYVWGERSAPPPAEAPAARHEPAWWYAVPAVAPPARPLPTPAPPAASGETTSVEPPSGTAARVPAERVPLSTDRSGARPRADVDAVRQTLMSYQRAYTQMDLGAIAAVWPSVDAAEMRRAFAEVALHSLTFGECRVTTAGSLATAVCPGLLRYVGRADGGRMETRQGLWTIALERRDGAWQIVRLHAGAGV